MNCSIFSCSYQSRTEISGGKKKKKMHTSNGKSLPSNPFPHFVHTSFFHKKSLDHKDAQNCLEYSARKAIYTDNFARISLLYPTILIFRELGGWDNAPLETSNEMNIADKSNIKKIDRSKLPNRVVSARVSW